MHRRHYLLVFFWLFTACQSDEISVPVSFIEKVPTLLKEEGTALFQYWEFENQPYLWADSLGDIPAIKTYLDSLKLVQGDSLTQFAIQRQANQETPKGPIPVKDSLSNYDLVHQGYLGRVRPISFLEAEILNYQLQRYPLLGHPTEFHGFIALNDSLQKVRVYFAASDEPFPPRPGILIDHLTPAQDSGWQLHFHLHNHYEEADNYYVGITAPSQADAQYFKALRERFQLKEALVTNGFHTAVLKAEELDFFNSH